MLSSEGYATQKGRTVLSTSSQVGPEQVRDFLEWVWPWREERLEGEVLSGCPHFTGP